MIDKRIYKEPDPWREKIENAAIAKVSPNPAERSNRSTDSASAKQSDTEEAPPISLTPDPPTPAKTAPIPIESERPVRHQPRRRALVFLMAVAFGGVCTAAAFSVLKILRPAYEPMNALRVTVIDGDTISIQGAPQNVRLVGFNAPETGEPLCAQERGLGLAATDMLKRLVATNDLDFTYVRCACPPGTAGTSDCNYGRACGSLRVGGKDVGTVLIEEGLAVPFACGWTSCPPLPRPWCGETIAAPAPLMGGIRSSPADCVIKGNISINTGERIYHVPGQRYYSDTQISPGKGERWFCSEEEARAAGWRRSRR